MYQNLMRRNNVHAKYKLLMENKIKPNQNQHHIKTDKKNNYYFKIRLMIEILLVCK